MFKNKTVILTWSNVMVQVLNFNDSICNTFFGVFIPDHTFYASVHLKEPDESVHESVAQYGAMEYAAVSVQWVRE